MLALPDLTGLSVVCRTGADTGVTAELFFDKYQGDWNALLNALFAADIRKVSHNVKDLTRTLLENGLRAEGFVFDTALAAYLLERETITGEEFMDILHKSEAGENSK